MTPLPALYRMARHLLLRHDDEALVSLRQLIADGTIGATELASWPLFDRLRQAGLLDDLLGPAGGTAMTGPITEERYRKIPDLAVERVRDAESCADAGCYPAACVMGGAGTEAAIMAHVCVCAAEVRAAGRWHKSRSAPFDWSLEQLIQIAVAMGWLPATRVSIAADEAIDKLTARSATPSGSCSTPGTWSFTQASTSWRRPGYRRLATTNTPS